MMTIDELEQYLPEHYPAAFGRPTPLAIGIHEQILKALPAVEVKTLRKLLGRRCNCWHAYLAVCKKPGVMRLNLDGSVGGVVTVEDAAYAKDRLLALSARNQRPGTTNYVQHKTGNTLPLLTLKGRRHDRCHPFGKARKAVGEDDNDEAILALGPK